MATKRESEPFPETEEGWQDLAKQNEQALAPVSRKVTLAGNDGVTEVSIEELRNLSLEQLANLLPATQASDVIESDSFGKLTDDKDRFVGTPFVIVHWEFHDGDYGKFVSMWIMTNAGERFILNDGSAGICKQLMTLTANTGQDSMLVCPKGLRRSDYTYTDPKTGRENPASTHYLDVSA